MRRRPSALTLLAAISLLAAALAGPLLPAAAGTSPYGSHVYQANPYVVPDAQSYPIYSGSTVAQSFLVNQTYALGNVTLRVMNLGNKFNVLNVSIHPDDPVAHLPVMSTTLAYRPEITNANQLSNASWTFSPPPILEEGQTYWIVAQNTAPQANTGYEWYSTNGTTYPQGQALLASPTWAGLPVDMFFITFGQEVDANLTPALTANRTQAPPGDSVIFTVYLNNTGASVASRAWVNDTLSTAFTNVSLGFPGIQPLSAAAFPNLVFPSVTNAPHSFTVTAQVAIGTPPGSVVTSAVSLAYTNETGVVVQAGTVTASIRVGLVTKEMYLRGTSANGLKLSTTAPTSSTLQTISLSPGSAAVGFVLTPSLARPLHVLNASATLWLRPQHVPPQRFSLTLNLLDNGTSVASLSPTFSATSSGLRPFSFGFPVSNYTFGAGHSVGLQIDNLGGPTGSTDTLVVGYNSTSNDSQVDVLTDTYVSIQDLVLSNQNGPTTDWSTLDSLVVQANVSDPFGASRIQGAWVNITDPSGRLAAAGAMTVALSDPSGLPAWKVFAYTLAPPLSTGVYRVVVTALEDNGLATLAQAWARVTTPAMGFAGIPSTDRVGTGQTFAVFLYYNNTGTGPAGPSWINDTVPAGLAYVTSGLPYTSVSGSTYTWALSGIPAGANVLEVDLQVTATSVDWVQNAASLAYQDLSGHLLGTLWSNTSVFLNGPIIALSVTGQPSTTVHANQTVTYTVTLANTGAAAGAVWLNATLPAGFTYGGTNATGLGATVAAAGELVGISFPGMPANTTWRFDLMATAGPALVRNATYNLGTTLAYTSSSGNPMPGDAGELGLVAASPWIPAGAVTAVTNPALPGDNATVLVSFINEGNEPASRLWVNLTLDPRLSMNNASLAYTTVSGTVAFALTDVAVGPFSFTVNVTVDPATPDHATLSLTGTLDAQDAIGNPLPRTTLAPAAMDVAAAQLSLAVTPQPLRLEAGIPSPLAITVTNGGHDSAANAWLNLTLPFGLDYANDTASVTPSASGSVYTWHWTGLAPGTVSFEVNLEARASLPNGTTAPLGLVLDYEGSDLQPRPVIALDLEAVILAPSLTLSVTADASSIAAGAAFVYTLRMTNQGMTTAGTVYLVDTVDSMLQVITYESSVAATVDNGTFVWTFSGLAPGATEVVNLTVEVGEGVAPGTIIPNVFEATYTNSAGSVLGRVRSTPVTVTVAADYSAFLWIGLGAVVFALLAAGLLRWKKVDIEDVFLVYRDGVLISHLSRTLLREKDEDVLSGMLTAVQEFVREAFQYGEHRDLHQMDFGDYRILIERGRYVFLAVVYSGKESLALRKKVRSVIERVEGQFGAALESWDGDMERVMGARDLVRDTLLGSANHNHAARASAESE